MGEAIPSEYNKTRDGPSVNVLNCRRNFLVGRAWSTLKFAFNAQSLAGLWMSYDDIYFSLCAPYSPSNANLFLRLQTEFACHLGNCLYKVRPVLNSSCPTWLWNEQAESSRYPYSDESRRKTLAT